MPIFIGAAIGVFIGFLLRPSAPLIGQLPFGSVITRGADLTGMDLLLKGTAEMSFNFLLLGAILGAFAGWIIKQQSIKNIKYS